MFVVTKRSCGKLTKKPLKLIWRVVFSLYDRSVRGAKNVLLRLIICEHDGERIILLGTINFYVIVILGGLFI